MKHGSGPTTRLHADFRDLISELNSANVDYLIVGAFALAAHGMPRFTGDLDVLYRRDPDNVTRLLQAIRAFGYTSSELTPESLLDADRVHYFGRPPLRVDLLSSISGVAFEDAWQTRMSVVLDGLNLNVLGLEQLIVNKRASGRPKDLVDLEVLEKAKKPGGETTYSES